MPSGGDGVAADRGTIQAERSREKAIAAQCVFVLERSVRRQLLASAHANMNEGAVLEQAQSGHRNVFGIMIPPCLSGHSNATAALAHRGGTLATVR